MLWNQSLRNSLEFVSAEFSGICLCGILWNSSGIRLVEEGEGLLFLLGVDTKNIDHKTIDAVTSHILVLTPT